MKYRIRYYRTRRGDSPVEIFIDNLDKTVCAKVYVKLRLLEEYGLSLFKGKVEKVKGYDFYELKVSKGKKGNIRIFFYIRGSVIHVLDALDKRSQKLRKEDLRKSTARLRSILR